MDHGSYTASIPFQHGSPVSSRALFGAARKPKRRRNSETDSIATSDTDLDEAFADDTVPSPPKPKRVRADGGVDGFGRLSLSHTETVAPDSPVFEDEDEIEVEEDPSRNGLLHPLIADALRREPPPLVPFPSKETHALVLYQPVVKAAKPDEVVEADSSEEDEAPINWPGRRKRRSSLPETIEIEEPWPVGPASRVESTPRRASVDEGDDMDVDE